MHPWAEHRYQLHAAMHHDSDDQGAAIWGGGTDAQTRSGTGASGSQSGIPGLHALPSFEGLFGVSSDVGLVRVSLCRDPIWSVDLSSASASFAILACSDPPAALLDHTPCCAVPRSITSSSVLCVALRELPTWLACSSWTALDCTHFPAIGTVPVRKFIGSSHNFPNRTAPMIPRVTAHTFVRIALDEVRWSAPTIVRIVLDEVRWTALTISR